MMRMGRAPRLHARIGAALLTAVVVGALGGCASTPTTAVGAGAGGGAGAATSIDPWENFNRKVYSFNDSVDRAILKPVAQTYRDVVPQLVRTGIDNVLGNIYDVWSTANNFLQGKVQVGFEMGMRVLSNTLFGLGGLLDPATEMGLTRRAEDFGQTLGTWGFPTGPYLVLPLLGPSTVRDTAGLVVDRQAAPSTLPDTSTGKTAVAAVEIVNLRTNLLSAGDLVDQVALDRYSFVRDAYLASRRNAVYDGAPPPDAFDYGTDDTPPPPAAPASAPRPAAPSAPASAPAK